PATRTCTAPKTEPRPLGSGRSGPVHRHPNPPERRCHAPTPTSSAPKGRRAVATGGARPRPRPSGTRGSRPSFPVLPRRGRGTRRRERTTPCPPRCSHTAAYRALAPSPPPLASMPPCLDAFFSVVLYPSNPTTRPARFTPCRAAPTAPSVTPHSTPHPPP